MMDRRDEDGGKRFEDRRVKEKKPDVRTRAQTLSLKSLQPPILLLNLASERSPKICVETNPFHLKRPKSS